VATVSNPSGRTLKIHTYKPRPIQRAVTAPKYQSSKTNMKTHTVPSRSSTKPVHKIRHGAVSASIWRQEAQNGPMFNVTFQRSYKDGETWKNSSSFTQKNLLVLGLIAARAFEWIGSQPRAAKT
jgi:hypothetical protein